jgi:hypothetical protein
MKIPFLLLIYFAATNSLQAQNQTEKSQVEAKIHSLFDGMKLGDTAKVRSVFHTGASLFSTRFDEAGNSILASIDLNKFILGIGENHLHVFDERLTKIDVSIDDNLAIAWTPYQFYIDDVFSHCGVNAIQLVKIDKVWKIIHLVDTRRKDNCIEQ